MIAMILGRQTLPNVHHLLVVLREVVDLLSDVLVLIRY